MRTKKILEDALFADLAWRKKELITIKIAHDGARDHQKEMLRRAGIALLYAHWEGYVKYSGSAYINFVVKQGHKFHDLEDNFVVLGAKSQITQFAETGRGKILCEVVEFIRSRLNEKCKIGWDNAVQTKSNLNAVRTRDIITILGLDYTPFEIYEKTVIDNIVALRNSIAHGRNQEVTPAIYVELHEKILILMDEIFDQIINAVVWQTYLSKKKPKVP